VWGRAEQRGERRARREWVAGVGRINCEPETNSLAVHVARVRAKLEPFGLSRLIATHPDGGYFLDLPPQPGGYLNDGA